MGQFLLEGSSLVYVCFFIKERKLKYLVFYLIKNNLLISINIIKVNLLSISLI